jgi:hypothetical protein
MTLQADGGKDGGEVEPGSRQTRDIEEASAVPAKGELLHQREHAARGVPLDVMRTAAVSPLEASQYDEDQKSAYLGNMVEGTVNPGGFTGTGPARWLGRTSSAASSERGGLGGRRHHEKGPEAISANTTDGYGAGQAGDGEIEGEYESESGETIGDHQPSRGP